MGFSGPRPGQATIARLERVAMCPWWSQFGAAISLRLINAPWPAILDVARAAIVDGVRNPTTRPSSRLTAGLAVAPRPGSAVASTRPWG